MEEEERKKKGWSPPRGKEDRKQPRLESFFLSIENKTNPSERKNLEDGSNTHTHTYIYHGISTGIKFYAQWTRNNSVLRAKLHSIPRLYEEETWLRGDGRPHHLFSKVFNQTLADRFFVPFLVSTTPGRDLFSSLPSSPPPPLKGTISGKSRRDAPLLSRHLVTRLQRYHPRGGKHPKGEEIFAITIAVGGNERWLKCIFGKIG